MSANVVTVTNENQVAVKVVETGVVTVGSPGPQGPTGPQGSVYTPRGSYINDGSTQYYPNDLVEWQGSSYVCILEHHGATPPNATYWQLLASKGDTGADGADGLGVPAGGTTGQVLAKQSNANNDTVWVDPPSTSGPVRKAAFFDKDTGLLGGLGAFGYRPDDFDGLDFQSTIVPNATTNYRQLHNTYIGINPTVTNARENWQIDWMQVGAGTDDSGKQVGDLTDGGVYLLNRSFVSTNKSNFGRVNIFSGYVSVGNGTDPIEGGDVSIFGGNIQIETGSKIRNFDILNYAVNASGTAQAVDQNFRGVLFSGNFGSVGEGAQFFQAGINFESVSYVNGVSMNSQFEDVVNGINAFADFQQVHNEIGGGYLSFTAQPILNDANGYLGLNVSPTIANLTGSADGVNVNMDNVTPYAGVKASLVFQDLTYEFNEAGSFNNGYTLEYIDDVSAGAEYAALVGMAIQVHIESGVSTANQVKAAVLANLTFASAITVTGGGSNPQVAAGPTSFAGGVNPGQVRAAYFKGNVQIDGSLSFSGALSIGKLNAFDSEPLVSGSGSPASIHMLITQPTIAANATLTLADVIGVNTAALISAGDNSNVTTAFLGVAALGLPAVLTMGSGSVIDRVRGAVFALSLDAGATGGTVNDVALCNAVAIPNGATTVDRLHGYKFELPFGAVGTEIFSFHSGVADARLHNAGPVVLGSTDTPANASVGLQLESTTKAVLFSRMTTTQRDALTATDGMVIFNTTAGKFQGYASAVWVDLH